ncbi:MAG: twin-arginine translocase TatA/TatE family subunit [Actinomycetota bacterium]|nr:twin-arginine translocase TatA/TatE family subunit [Actinomycetota bacterium]
MPSIHPANLAIVAVVALVVLGPEKLPGTLRTLGRLWSDFQRVRQGLEQQLRQGFGAASTSSSLPSWRASGLSARWEPRATNGSTAVQSSAAASPTSSVERPLWMDQVDREVPRSYLGAGPLVASAEERSFELGAPSAN